MVVAQSVPAKRSAPCEPFGLPPQKKQNRRQVRHHQSNWDLQRGQLKEPWQDEQTIEYMLTRSIGIAMKAVGFKAAAPEAIEAFRVDVEECMSSYGNCSLLSVALTGPDMAHFLTDVRQSMLSCRRTQAIPQDFLQSLHTHQLSLRSLLPHLDPPVNPSETQFPLQTDTPQDSDEQQLRFLGPLLNAEPDTKLQNYVPKHFPELPSRHTYKATPEYPEYEQDPRKVREKATEEGRLAEEALRRVVSARAGKPAQESQQGRRIKSGQAVRDQLWMDTMQAVTQETSNGTLINNEAGIGKGKQKERSPPPVSWIGYGRLDSAVNAEKKYWRQPVLQRKETNGNI